MVTNIGPVELKCLTFRQRLPEIKTCTDLCTRTVSFNFFFVRHMYRSDDSFYSWVIYIFWLLHKRNLVLNKSDHDLTLVLAYKEFFGGCSVAQNLKFSFCGCKTECRLLAARTMGISS